MAFMDDLNSLLAQVNVPRASDQLGSPAPQAPVDIGGLLARIGLGPAPAPPELAGGGGSDTLLGGPAMPNVNVSRPPALMQQLIGPKDNGKTAPAPAPAGTNDHHVRDRWLALAGGLIPAVAPVAAQIIKGDRETAAQQARQQSIDPIAAAIRNGGDSRAIAPIIAAGVESGGLSKEDADTYMSLAKAYDPKLQQVGSQIKDLNDPNNTNSEVFDHDKGQQFVYGPEGKSAPPIGVRNMDGSVQMLENAAYAQSAGSERGKAQYAGQIAGEQAAATAPYETVTIQDAQGRPMVVSKAQVAQMQGGGQQAAQTAATGTPRAVRNNNPLNLTVLPHGAWDGQTGADGRFAVFSTPEAGMAAADKNLFAYSNVHGIKTLSGIISRWAPQGENDTGKYIQTVASDLGVDPNAPLNLADPNVRSRILQSMSKVEIGGSGVPAQAPPATTSLAGGVQPLSVGKPKIEAQDAARVAKLQQEADDSGRVAQLADGFMDLNAKHATGMGMNPLPLHIPGVGTIPLNPIPTIARTGVPGLVADQPEYQQMRSITNRAWPLLRPTGSGRMLQAETQGFKTAFPNVENMGTENAGIAKQLHAEASNRRAFADFMSNYLNEHGSLAGGDEAFRATQGRGGSGSPPRESAVAQVRPPNPVAPGQAMSAAQFRAEAQLAIRRGADPAKVRARLKAMHVDPSGL